MAGRWKHSRDPALTNWPLIEHGGSRFGVTGLEIRTTIEYRLRRKVQFMALIGTHKRTLSRAGKPMASGNGVRSFTSGLLFGLSSVSLFFAGEIRPPKAPADGIASDWKSVGADMAAAMGKRVG